MIQLTKTTFRPCVRHHSGGSSFLGYLYTQVVCMGGFTIGMPDLQVRLTRDGNPRIDFPTRVATVKGKEERFALYFTATKESREALTTAIFALPEIQATLAQALATRAA